MDILKVEFCVLLSRRIDICVTFYICTNSGDEKRLLLMNTTSSALSTGETAYLHHLAFLDVQVANHGEREVAPWTFQ